MTSVLNVDTIADKAGTGPVALTKQDPAKAWVNYNQATPIVNSSLNNSSVTDSSAGRFNVNFTSVFSGANEYNWSGMSQSGSGTAYNSTIQMDGTPTTAFGSYETVFNNNTFSDLANGVTIHGDLA